uniref:Tetratricopeptide repeat-containing protein n=1 Tax=Candidatus Kentrum sp. FM TaxID=2126340 RepID=A0A450RZ60_9GAMM|nr:MAG: hypothetical protein BECKFM1743A_GA0114220_1001812 [Candidatus Kentron sp. FM]VFJ53659.1 MAG: hypothetical protein BECKFM1743C_GA0114222_101273 [Candidatus Kentron sp. FM]VFK09879.1 MAG: hypothetical protein BECKFM1743B_GA0114221_101194 [Candidatus Kentron sp. FM]
MKENLPPELLSQLEAIISLPLMDVHRRVERLPYQLAEAALEMLVEALRDNPQRLEHEDPNSMHNLVMHASKIQHSDIEEQLLGIFIGACPSDVDLQADLLQFYYGNRWDLAGCERQWQILNDDEIVNPAEREANWRYWVFGALYHARVKHDIATAQELMRQGLEAVPGRHKSDILRNFENVFIDFAAGSLLNHEAVLDALKEGVAAGWSGGYTLALKLATLLQQRALTPKDTGSEKNIEPKNEKSIDLLRKALDWLSVAESLFTNNPNHPITEIYRARINILMGLEDYRAAIDYMDAFYNHDPEEARRDPSLKAQLILACRRAGEPDLWKKIIGESPEEENIIRQAAQEQDHDTAE